MHHSRLCAVLIDCNTGDVDQAAHFWADALGRPVDLDHPGSEGNYRMLAFGLAMVLIMVFRPRGLVSHREPSIRLHPAGSGGGG